MIIKFSIAKAFEMFQVIGHTLQGCTGTRWIHLKFIQGFSLQPCLLIPLMCKKPENIQIEKKLTIAQDIGQCLGIEF